MPFEVTIPEAEQDKKLPEKLREELPGILAWIVRGCLEWQRDGLGEPEEVRSATTSYRADMDVLARFIEDRCVVDPDAWTKRSFEPDRGTGNVPIRRGIGLRDDRRPDPEVCPRVTREAESYPTVSVSNPDRYA